MGLVVTSLVAAYMSTLSTMLNLGASYVVNDFYLRFIKPDSTQKHLILIGRLSTVVIMILGGMLALNLKNALQSFGILLQIGAGTGLIYILRWYWWRINALSEIVAMTVSFLIAMYFAMLHERFFDPVAIWQELIFGIGLTTLSWIVAALITPTTDMVVLKAFVCKTKAPGWGWAKIRKLISHKDLSDEETGMFDFQAAILAFGAGVIGVYGLLFGLGKMIFGDHLLGTVLLVMSFLAFLILNGQRDKF